MLSDRVLRNFDRFNRAIMAAKRGPEGAYDALPKSLAKAMKRGVPLKVFEKGGALDNTPSSAPLDALQQHFLDKMQPEDAERANELLGHLLDALGKEREDDAEDDLDVDMKDREEGEMETRGGKMKTRGANDRRRAHDSRSIRSAEADYASFNARFPDAAKIQVR